MRIRVELDVEEKETVPDEAVVPMIPDAIRSYVQDVLCDDTKHSNVTTWRVLSVVLA